MKKWLLLSSLLAVMTAGLFSPAHGQEIYASARQSAEEPHTSFAHKPLKKVMHELRLKRGIYFMFNNKDIQQLEVDGRINLSASVEEILSRLLTPIGLTYKKVGNIYIILEKEDTEIRQRVKEKITRDQAIVRDLSDDIARTNAAAQEDKLEIILFSISGRVTSETGEGMPGVNVLVKGTTIGTTTDAEGQYKLEAPNGSGTLVFSFIGYLPQEDLNSR